MVAYSIKILKNRAVVNSNNSIKLKIVQLQSKFESK